MRNGSYRRSPHGERGLKWQSVVATAKAWMSLPTRGAWIEMPWSVANLTEILGRSPHGERGLKFTLRGWVRLKDRRSPHGERGLKFVWKLDRFARNRSLPTRGAWIEMSAPTFSRSLPASRSPHGERGLKYGQQGKGVGTQPGRSPHGERGLKYRDGAGIVTLRGSLPTRGAWIEMAIGRLVTQSENVAPHTGSVD